MVVDLKNNIKVAAKTSVFFIAALFVVSKFNTTLGMVAVYCIGFVFLTLLIFIIGSIMDALKDRKK